MTGSIDLDMLALGCLIAAAGIGGTLLLLVLVNRVTGRTRLTFKDEAPSRDGDRK